MENCKLMEMAEQLCRCAEGDCDEKCPYIDVEQDCSAVLMTEAAKLLKEVAGGA